MKVLLSLLGGVALLGALLMGGRRYRCTCPALAALEEAGAQLVSYVPPGSPLLKQAQSLRHPTSEPALALTRLGQIAMETEHAGIKLPDQFWQSLLTAAQVLEHPDWPEIIQLRLQSGFLPRSCLPEMEGA